MADKKQIEALVQSALDRTETRRLQELARFRERNEQRALSNGTYSIGRDENGLPVGTMTPKVLGMKINGWRVCLSFRHDDRKRLKEMGWRDVEAAIKSGSSPAKVVETENHILVAVRELNHILEGYKGEVAARLDRSLSLVYALIRLNMEIHLKGGEATDADIKGLISTLEALRKELESKRSAIGAIVAPAKLSEAISKFKKTLEGSPKQRAFLIGTACAVLISVPENLTKWRDKRIAAAVSKTYCRLASLRVERDKWLFSQLLKFCSNTSCLSEFVELDGKKKEVLERVNCMIDEMIELSKSIRNFRRKTERLQKKKDAAAESISLLAEARKAYRIKNEEAVRLLEDNAAIFYPGKVRPTTLYGDYGWIHRYLKSHKLQEAKKKIKEYILFLDSNKPRFILDELSKSPEPYLASVVGELKKAVEAFEAKDLNTAKRHFSSAASEMRKIMFPGEKMGL